MYDQLAAKLARQYYANIKFDEAHLLFCLKSSVQAGISQFPKAVVKRADRFQVQVE